MTELKKIRMKLRKQYMWGSTSRLRYWKMRIFHSESYYTLRFLLHLRSYEYLIKQKTTILMKLRRAYHLSLTTNLLKNAGL